jgi:Dullard-like phosphatase family protein
MKESLKQILYKAKLEKETGKSDLYKNNYYTIKRKNNNLNILNNQIEGRITNEDEEIKSKKISVGESRSKSKNLKEEKKQISVDGKFLIERNKFENDKKEKSEKNKIGMRESLPKPEPYPFKELKKSCEKNKNSVEKKNRTKDKNKKKSSEKDKKKEIHSNDEKKEKSKPRKSTDKKKKKEKVSSSIKSLNNPKKVSFLNSQKNSRSNSKRSKISVSKNSKKSNSKDSGKSGKTINSLSPDSLSKKLHQRSLIAQNSFKLNLQDIIKVDEIYNSILNTKYSLDSKTTSLNFDLLKEFFINNYCFILKDLSVLFYKLDFRNKMRKFYLKEIVFFTYLFLLLVQTRMEAGLLKKHKSLNGGEESNFSDRYYENVNKEIYELLIQIFSNLHVVFILRIEIFLDRAAMYYQNHKLFKKIKLVLSKRKSNYNLNIVNKEENFVLHIQKIDRYLDLTEQALEEVFKLNNNFVNLSHFLFESLLHIVRRKNEVKISEYNKLLENLRIKFDSKGLVGFDADFLSSLIYPKSLGEVKNDALVSEKSSFVEEIEVPFIKHRKSGKKFTLILDLDETIIYYPDEKIGVFDKSFKQHIQVRPFSKEFLKEVGEFFEIIIFTAASQHYADQILNHIDPEGLIQHRLYRQHLTDFQGKPIKDLSKIGRELHKMVILDNTPENFVLQPDNGVFIKSWRGDMKDKCLLWLSSIFINIAKSGADDIREVLVELKNLLLANYS